MAKRSTYIAISIICTLLCLSCGENRQEKQQGADSVSIAQTSADSLLRDSLRTDSLLRDSLRIDSMRLEVQKRDSMRLAMVKSDTAKYALLTCDTLVRRLSQLREKTVGMSRWDATERLFDTMMQQAKMQEGDCFPIEVGDQDLRCTMMLQGIITAAFLREPQLSKAKEQGARELVFSDK